MCGYCGCQQSTTHQHDHEHHNTARLVQIEQDILSENQRFANENRAHFKKNNILTLNLMSSPGSGKTTLLVESIKMLQQHCAISVIEGDQQTDLDAQRIAATGIPVLQIQC